MRRIGQYRERSGHESADDLDDEKREADQARRLELPYHFVAAFLVGGFRAFFWCGYLNCLFLELVVV